MMQNHIGCICSTSLPGVFSNESPSCLHEMMQSCIGLVFLHCVHSNVSVNELVWLMQNHKCCICVAWLHVLFFSYGLLYWHHSYSNNYFQDSVPSMLLYLGCALAKEDHFKLRFQNRVGLEGQKLKVKYAND